MDKLDGWRAVVDAGGERWRRRQVAAIVRDVPSEAVRVFQEELGYRIEPPDEVPEDRPTSLI